jgi:carbon monoxide dehydrogenase subunit G
MKNTKLTWHTEYSIETSATPARIWDLLRDVPGWKKWNSGIEEITLEGPFQNGTWFSMKPPGQDSLRSRLIDVREGEGFVDETRLGELVVTVAHRIQRVTEGRTRVTYAVDAEGPESAEVGPAIAADFPEVLAALVALATEVAS